MKSPANEKIEDCQMKIVLIESQYLPPISYFTAIQDVAQLIIEKYEHFVKQSYRNRCYINTTQGKEMLTIPLTAKHGKVRICDVRIDYSQKWLNNHWRTLESAYNSAPFFEYYADELNSILFKKFTFLYDLNYELLSLCLKWLKLKIDVRESAMFEEMPSLSVQDMRNIINAKNPAGSNKYYKPVEYNQVFGNMFVKNLSLVDLIFCTGPSACKLVQVSLPE